MDFSESENDESLEDTAKEYEKIFEEIQNFEIPDKALDKIEEVLDENISLKQENQQMLKQIEELQVSIDAQNFRSVFSNLKARQNNQVLLSPDENSVSNRPSLIPPPPPPPPTPGNMNKSKPKYRLLFWDKLENVSNSIFDNSQSIKIRPVSINKFPFSTSKPPLIITPENKIKSLDYSREIVINSALRSLGSNLNLIISKIENSSKDFFEDPDRVKALSRAMPTPSEASNISQLFNKGIKLTQTEEFLYKLSQMSHLKSFLDCAQFKLNFTETLSDLLTCFKNWKNLCVRLKSNKRLQSFFKVLLVFGNELNQNHNKLGQAQGFKLNILSSLAGIKSSVDGSSLLEALIDEFFFITGNPHIFHRSEHLLLRELSISSFQSLLDSYDCFFQDFCRFSSMDFPDHCKNYVKEFVKSKNKDVESLFEVMNETKVELKSLHSYFLHEEIVDDEGKFDLFVQLVGFYDKYLEIVGKKWSGVSNRDSRRFTFISESKTKFK